MGVYTIVAAALLLRVGILVVIPLSVTKAAVGLQQTQAGRAPTLVRHAILVLHLTIWLGLPSQIAEEERHPVLPTPELESLPRQSLIDCESFLH